MAEDAGKMEDSLSLQSHTVAALCKEPIPAEYFFFKALTLDRGKRADCWQ